jgi:hypothetical protein
MANACGRSGNDSAMMRVTTVESTPPDSIDATGTSLINCRRTAAASSARIASRHSPCDRGRLFGANPAQNGRSTGSSGRRSSGMRQAWPGGSFQARRKKVFGAGTKR